MGVNRFASMDVLHKVRLASNEIIISELPFVWIDFSTTLCKTRKRFKPRKYHQREETKGKRLYISIYEEIIYHLICFG